MPIGMLYQRHNIMSIFWHDIMSKVQRYAESTTQCRKHGILHFARHYANGTILLIWHDTMSKVSQCAIEYQEQLLCLKYAISKAFGFTGTIPKEK